MNGSVPENLQFHQVHGPELGPWLGPLGELRIRVFREFPYLYDGSPEYERDYLGVYQKSAGSLVVLVTAQSGILLGASTCLPLADEGSEFQAPFIAHGRDFGKIMYFGESIVLPEWRGRGLGRIFFDLREAHARRLGMREAAFCAVDRSDDQPARPPDFRPLDGFWRSRGYEQQPALRAILAWKEIGEDVASEKSLTFWNKRLDANRFPDGK